MEGGDRDQGCEAPQSSLNPFSHPHSCTPPTLPPSTRRPKTHPLPTTGQRRRRASIPRGAKGDGEWSRQGEMGWFGSAYGKEKGVLRTNVCTVTTGVRWQSRGADWEGSTAVSFLCVTRDRGWLVGWTGTRGSTRTTYPKSTTSIVVFDRQRRRFGLLKRASAPSH